MVMSSSLARFWANDQGQDIAEYAVMLAVILVIVVGAIRLIGSNANTIFSQAASSIQSSVRPSSSEVNLLTHSHRFPFAKPYRCRDCGGGEGVRSRRRTWTERYFLLYS